jgi:hypothetical protein
LVLKIEHINQPAFGQIRRDRKTDKTEGQHILLAK